MAKKQPQKRKPTDATMRNVRASRKELVKLRAEIRVLRERISHMRDVKRGVG